MKLTLAGCPIFLRSPQRSNNFLSSLERHGSLVRIRYFLPGLLSFEPLGTTLIMLPIGFRVNGKMTLSSEIKSSGIRNLR